MACFGHHLHFYLCLFCTEWRSHQFEIDKNSSNLVSDINKISTLSLIQSFNISNLFLNELIFTWPPMKLLVFLALSFWSVLVGLSFSTKELFKLDFSKFSQLWKIVVSKSAEFSEFDRLTVTSFPSKSKNLSSKLPELNQFLSKCLRLLKKFVANLPEPLGMLEAAVFIYFKKW